MKFLIPVKLALVLLLSACASGPSIVANTNPETDLTQQQVDDVVSQVMAGIWAN